VKKNWELFIFFISMLFSCSSLFSVNWSYQLLHQENVNNQAQYRFSKWTSLENNKPIYINSVLLNQQHYTAHIIDQENTFNFFSVKQIYKTTLANNGFLGINGGFFTPDNKPLGLLIIDGKQISNFSRSYLLTGLILINKAGDVAIIKRGTKYSAVNNVIQTGPFLIFNNKLEVKKQGKVDRRTVLVLTDKNDLLVISSSETTLFDLATILMQHPEAFNSKKIKVAINLDGGTSTAMSLFLPAKQPLIIPEILPVRSGIIFKLK